MLQRAVIILLVSTAFFSDQTAAQKTARVHRPLTSKYGGVYAYGNDLEKGRAGTITIYPESDTGLLFYIELNHGTPTYNKGAYYGRVKMTDSSAVFSTDEFAHQGSAWGCKWAIHFSKDKLTISTLDKQDVCGFGEAVIADGEFERKSNIVPEYFVNQEGTKFYFKNTTPEVYNNH